MPSKRRITAVFAPLLAAAVLTACGGSDGGQIPPDEGHAMQNLILEIASDVDAGTCDEAATGAAALRDRANGLLQSTVGRQLRDALVEGSLRLETLVAEQCGVDDGDDETTTTTTTTTEPTTTTTTEPTTTTTTETTTTETTTEEEPPPVDPGGGLGPGNG